MATVDGVTISRNGLAEQVCDALRELIVDQALAPGQRVNITALARRLGVSETPVREALGRLQSERLLTFEAYVGYAVMPLPTPARLNELLDVRRLLESRAARVGAATVSAPQLEGMRRALDALERLQAGPTFSQSKDHIHHDHAFHTAIVQASGNGVLGEVFRSLNLHVVLSRLYFGRGVAELEQSRREHRAILGAYEARDPGAAELAVVAHIEAARTRQLDRVRRLTSAAGPGTAGEPSARG